MGVTDLLSAMDEGGVEKSVVFGFPWNQSGTFRRHNDYIMEAVLRYGDRLIGFGCFGLAGEGIVRETERCLSGGLSGIGELALYQSGIDSEALKRLAPVMKVCRDQDVPVLIHTNEPVGHDYPGKTPILLSQIYDMVRAFGENRIVLAHWGGGIFFYSLLKKAVKESLANVWFDTAASPFLYDPEVYGLACRTVGAEKILFGSDYPLIKPARYFREIDEAGLDAGLKEKICGLNAASLLKLTP